MGTQFFWFYDILLAGVIVGICFKGMKKGFVSEIVGFLAAIIAFLVAFGISAPISDAVYDSFIEKPLLESIQGKTDDVLSGNSLTALSQIDMSKVTVGGKKIDELPLEPDTTGSVFLDLSDMDFSASDMKEYDMSAYGITNDMDISSIDGGKVTLTEADLVKNDIETIILARALTATITSETGYGQIAAAAESIQEVFPTLFGANTSSSKNDMMSSVLMSVIDIPSDNIGEAVCEGIVEPVIMVPMRAVIFFILFGILGLVLGLIAKLLTVINKIPILGPINVLLGAVVGIAEGFLAVVVICIALKIVISLSGNSLIFLNTLTIDKTFAFQYIYNMEILNFLS